MAKPNAQPGELWLKGPNIFLGYLDNPELTKAAMSACGYFKTGDIFRRDEHGNYYCVDRLKELIKYSSSHPPWRFPLAMFSFLFLRRPTIPY